MYWTSLGVSDEEVIALYHNHAVCEQYHSEIKTDMGIECLPSGKFETNALIFKLTMIAYKITPVKVLNSVFYYNSTFSISALTSR